MRPLLIPGRRYEDLRDGFRWTLPPRLNMARQACDDWAEVEPHRTALVDLRDGRREVSYGELAQLSHRVAAALAGAGVAPGDRVGVLLSQEPLTAAAHLAVWRIGAISVPLFVLFREDALRTRVADAGIEVAVTDTDGAARLAPLGVRTITVASLPESARPAPTAETGPDDPAVLIYTSGTTGSPKGALHGHRVLTGHLPGVEMSHDRLGQPGDVLWTPADWAWIGGLFDVLMPGLALGVPVVAARMEKFSPDRAAAIVAGGGVRNVFFPPTALRLLKAAGQSIPGLRSVASGGEPLGAEMLEWGRRAFGLAINEFYGQTECNMVASSAASLFPPRPGCIGKPAPGFEISVLGTDAIPTSYRRDAEGDIAVRRGAASMFLGYWNRPEETAAKFRGDWMLTGDRGLWEGGYLRFVGREDDVITSAGYRIGPAEIEDCLLTHPAVATCGVVGKPDPVRTEIVKAYVVLRPGHAPDPDLAKTLQEHVKTRLTAHAYPREIGFLDALPMTVTGKVIRKDLKALAGSEGETP